MNKKKLTDKQKLFCLFYVQSFNATQAYLKAYGEKNKISARVSGSKLLTKANIQEEIKNLQEELRQHYNFEFDDYVRELLKIVGADIGDYIKFGNRDGKNFVDLVESDSVDTSVISEIKQVKGNVTIKLHDKMTALKELARIFGFGENINDSELPAVFIDDLGKSNES